MGVGLHIVSMNYIEVVGVTYVPVATRKFNELALKALYSASASFLRPGAI